MTITATGGDRRITVDAVTRVISITPAASGGGGGVTDHGALTGLTDDDHAQYALADGSRGDFATTEQGGLADTATQPGDLGNSAGLDVGTTAGTVAAGDDSRFSDARTPTAHAASHTDGGADELALDASQITTGTLDGARVDAVPETLLDAKGDLIAGSAADTAAKVTVGANDTVLTADSTQPAGVKWATPAGGATTYANQVQRLFPADFLRAGYAFWRSTGTVSPVTTVASLLTPFVCDVTCTVTGLQIEVATGSAGSQHQLALYLCGDDGTPTTLVSSTAAIACDTTGYKSLTGLSISVSAGQVYAFASVAKVAGHALRGKFTSTTGLDQSVLGPVSPTESLYTGGDTSFRGRGYRYNPAVAGTPDASPTWILTGTFHYLPNIGMTLVAA